MTGAGDTDKGSVGEGHAHSLCLTPIHAVVAERTPGNAVPRPSCAAIDASAVVVCERGDNEVADSDVVHFCPDLLDHADELVADWAERVRGLSTVVPEVGATHARQHDADDCVGRRDDLWVGPLADLDRAWSREDSSTHGYASSVSAKLLCMIVCLFRIL